MNYTDINDNLENEYLNLDDMLQQNMTSYEYFNTLPESIKRRLENKDISSFKEMQKFVSNQKKHFKNNNI